MSSSANDFDNILKGASIRQLSLLFDLSRDTVQTRIRNSDIEPSGTRLSQPIYRVSEVAQLLVQPYLPRDQALRSPSIQQRNAATEKDYWDAQLKRQKFMENAGDLWRTEKVIQTLSEVFKQIRESVIVFLDAMEHESGLPHDQIEKSKQFGDTLLQNMRDRLVSMGTTPVGDHDVPDDIPGVVTKSESVTDDFDDFIRDLGI